LEIVKEFKQETSLLLLHYWQFISICLYIYTCLDIWACICQS